MYVVNRTDVSRTPASRRRASPRIITDLNPLEKSMESVFDGVDLNNIAGVSFYCITHSVITKDGQA